MRSWRSGDNRRRLGFGYGPRLLWEEAAQSQMNILGQGRIRPVASALESFALRTL
jgi:hypothetical protein